MCGVICNITWFGGTSHTWKDTNGAGAIMSDTTSVGVHGAVMVAGATVRCSGLAAIPTVSVLGSGPCAACNRPIGLLSLHGLNGATVIGLAIVLGATLALVLVWVCSCHWSLALICCCLESWSNGAAHAHVNAPSNALPLPMAHPCIYYWSQPIPQTKQPNLAQPTQQPNLTTHPNHYPKHKEDPNQ